MRVGAPVVAAASYVAAMTGVVYGVMDPGHGASDAAAIALLLALVLVHVATGIAADRWWIVLVPALPIAIAAPAGYPENVGGEPFPIWFTLAALSPLTVGLAALGVGLRRLAAHRG